MRVVLRPVPVLFACRGCPEYGHMARDVAAVLDRRGRAESTWLGKDPGGAAPLVSKGRSRFPVYAIDGCAEGCVRRWLELNGVKLQRHDVLDPRERDAERIADRVAAGW